MTVTDEIKHFIVRVRARDHFNHRILQEAEKKEVPLLERMAFLGIYSNNLDEFFRVRMASLNHMAQSKDKNLKRDRDKAKKTIKEINHLNSCYNKEFGNAVDEITNELVLNGSTNPVWLSEVKEIGATVDDGIFLAVKCMEWHDDKKKPKINYALISMPDKEMGRFVRLPQSDGKENIMYLDDVIRFCLPMIFVGSGIINLLGNGLNNDWRVKTKDTPTARESTHSRTTKPVLNSFFLEALKNKAYDDAAVLDLKDASKVGSPFMPSAASPLLTLASFDGETSAWFDKVSYVGAFNSTDNWLTGWANFDPQNTKY